MAKDYVATVQNVDVVLKEILDEYEMADVVPGMKDGITKTVKDMVRETKATAPVHKDPPIYSGWRFPKGDRKQGTFKKHITHSVYGRGLYCEGVWRVRSPEYRLTHLIENGHEQYVFGKKSKNKPYFEGLDFVEHARNKAELEVNGNIVEAISKRATGV